MTLAPAADPVVPEHPARSGAAGPGARVASRDTMRRIGDHVATLDSDAPGRFEESTQPVRRVTGP